LAIGSLALIGAGSFGSSLATTEKQNPQNAAANTILPRIVVPS
jgi:hypothetical protein